MSMIFASGLNLALLRQLLSDGFQHRQRVRSLCLSESMTKRNCVSSVGIPQFSCGSTPSLSVAKERKAFPQLVSYNRFVEWMPSVLLPLCAYLRHCFGQCTGISSIDSTSIKVCHNRRIAIHKVFNNLAARGKTSVDWFCGFKLHPSTQRSARQFDASLLNGMRDFWAEYLSRNSLGNPRTQLAPQRDERSLTRVSAQKLSREPPHTTGSGGGSSCELRQAQNY